MNSAPNFNKKIIYGLVIVALFGGHVSLHRLARRREEKTATWARPPSARSIPAAS